MNALETDWKAMLDSLGKATHFKKCHVCGCQQGLVNALIGQVEHFPNTVRPDLVEALQASRATFGPQQYDCLGCKTCYPGLVSRELAKSHPDVETESSCETDSTEAERDHGWPSLPGQYRVFRYQAPVAVCALNSLPLYQELSEQPVAGISLVGSLVTENLGIERIVHNVLENPNIRYLLLCGRDSEGQVGHLPGQSLLSLLEKGVDGQGRILGAQGRRPILKNIPLQAVEAFRRQVKAVDRIGVEEASQLRREAAGLAEKCEPVFEGGGSFAVKVPVIEASIPQPLVLDPSGYFVVIPDPARQRLTVEHYSNQGLLQHVLLGDNIGALYSKIVELGLLSRLDHACYLGKELARASHCLSNGEPYIQDAAPQPVVEGERKEASDRACGVGACDDPVPDANLRSSMAVEENEDSASCSCKSGACHNQKEVEDEP